MAYPNSKTYLQVITEALSNMESKLTYFKASSKENGLTTTSATDIIKSLILDDVISPPHAKEPFYVLDLGVLSGLMARWAHSLPEFRPFYAVKCNPDPAFLVAMAAMGSSFDCATMAEIESVLALGVSPDRIVFANPCKLESHVQYAASVGVNLTTFDSEAELHKILTWHPKCNLLIRLKPTEDGGGVRELGSKYGALPDEVEPLLSAAKAAGLPVVGVSFHVGSAAANVGAYAAAIAAARAAFDAAARLGMAPMRVLDVGGGFFASGGDFEEAALVIKAAVEEHFPCEMRPLGFGLIAEPGRFFAETAFSLAARIVGKRVRRGASEYWINDGIYGSLMGCVVLGARSGDLTCMPLALHACARLPDEAASFEGGEFESTVFGPTCDSLDMVLKGYRLPELEVGDWLVFPNMGAYSSVFKSNFNGFNTSPFRIYLVASQSDL